MWPGGRRLSAREPLLDRAGLDGDGLLDRLGRGLLDLAADERDLGLELGVEVLDAARAAYEVSDLYTAIMALSTTNLRTVMGSMDLDETLSKRDEINARLLSVVDQATEAWGVKIYSDYDQMLKHEGLEAVCVSTVTTVHAEQTIKAIEAGMHVLCEKPLSTKLEIV